MRERVFSLMDEMTYQPLLKAMVMLFLFLSFTTLSYFSMVKGKVEQQHLLIQQEKNLSKQLEQLRQLNFIEHESKSVQGKLATLEERLFKPEEVPRLMKTLTHMAWRYQVNFHVLKQEDLTQEHGLIARCLRIELSGDYPQLVRFLSQIARMKKFLLLTMFELEKPKASEVLLLKGVMMIDERSM